MPVAPWLTAEQNTDMPAPLASLWDFIRRDPFGGMTVSSPMLQSTMSKLAPTLSWEGGYFPRGLRFPSKMNPIKDPWGNLIDNPNDPYFKMVRKSLPPLRTLESPMTELPSFLSRIISTGSSDINAPQIVANMMKSPSGIDHYLNLLHQTLQRPNPIEDQYFNALIQKYMARSLP